MPVTPTLGMSVARLRQLPHRFLRHFQLLTHRKKGIALPLHVTAGQKSLALTPMLAARPGGTVDTAKSGVALAAKVETAMIAVFDSSGVAVIHFWSTT